MQITTELNPGELGFFLVDNEVVELLVQNVRTYASRNNPEPQITYEVYAPKSDAQMVPENRAGKTKAALLAKL